MIKKWIASLAVDATFIAYLAEIGMARADNNEEPQSEEGNICTYFVCIMYLALLQKCSNLILRLPKSPVESELMNWINNEYVSQKEEDSFRCDKRQNLDNVLRRIINQRTAGGKDESEAKIKIDWQFELHGSPVAHSVTHYAKLELSVSRRRSDFVLPPCRRGLWRGAEHE